MQKKDSITDLIHSIERGLFWTFRPVRCTNCHSKKPAFNFPVLHWHEESWCRKCSNTLLGENYFHGFSPIRDVIDHFKEVLR